MRTYWHKWPRTCLWEWGWISHEQSWLGTQIKISSLNLGIGRWKIWLIRAVDHDGEEEAWTCSFGNIPNIRQAMEAHCRPWERRGWLRYLEIWFEVSLVISRHCLKTTKRKIQRLLFQNTLCSQIFFSHPGFLLHQAQNSWQPLVLFKIYRRPKGPAPQVSWVAMAVEWTKGLTFFFFFQWPVCRKSSVWWRGAYPAWLAL